MYQIKRSDDKVVITDWNDKVIYSVPKDAYVVYRGSAQEVLACKVGDMNDEQLLKALAKSVKIEIS